MTPTPPDAQEQRPTRSEERAGRSYIKARVRVGRALPGRRHDNGHEFASHRTSGLR